VSKPPGKDMLKRENPYGRPGFVETLGSLGLDRWSSLTDRALGHPVVDHRTSWVRTLSIHSSEYYLKVYDYPSASDRRRGWGRTTWLAPSRPAREARALAWLRRHGFGAPEPVLVAENRRFGVLRTALLITAAWPGRPSDEVVRELAEPDRPGMIDAVVAEVRRLHRAGFRHRNLDPRNVLVRRDPQSAAPVWSVGFLDAPRHRLRRPTRASPAGPSDGSPSDGSPDDRGTRCDWQRLRPLLDARASNLGE